MASWRRAHGSFREKLDAGLSHQFRQNGHLVNQE